ncbi:MAG: CAP domain-containing protein [Candidatus Limnocylindrales bacterium]
MVPNVLAPGRRRLASLALIAVLGAAFAAPGGAVAETVPVEPAALTAAETAMVAALNVDRTERGLVPVRVDIRLMAIARARSDDMVANDYFSHVQPDGRNVFNILTAQGIKWYTAGEIIAWNGYDMDLTTDAANRQWMNSAGHKAIIISTNFNYVGVGLAVDPATGKKVWTAVYLKGPDRTSARLAVYTPRVTTGTTSSTRYVKVAWSGSDVRLQVLTAGLRGYTIQRRTDGGAWTTISSLTTLRTKTMLLRIGHRYEFRVLARDWAGNQSRWITRVADLR